jgi:hypothetical protein
MWNKIALAAICSLFVLLQTTAALAEEGDDTDEEAEEEAELHYTPFGLGGGGPFFTALVVQPAGEAEFGMLYGGKGFTYPTGWLRLSGIGFGGGFGYGQKTGAGFGMGGVGLEVVPRDGKKVEFPLGFALCFGGGEQTVEVDDKATGGSWTETEGGFIFMPMSTLGVEINPTAFMKIGFNVTMMYAVANPEDFWGFGGGFWLAFGQTWPAEE